MSNTLHLVGSGREGDPVRDARDDPHGSIPTDLKELLPKQATEADHRPMKYLWVYDPDKDELHIDHNEDKHPAYELTWGMLAPHVHHPDKSMGYAWSIHGGWRILDHDAHDVDPYIARRVHKALDRLHPPKSPPLFMR